VAPRPDRRNWIWCGPRAWRRWPPRLPGQPLFYLVLSQDYAAKIEGDWNVPRSGAGYVTRFRLRRSFLDRNQVEQSVDRTSPSTGYLPRISTTSTTTSSASSNSLPRSRSAAAGDSDQIAEFRRPGPAPVRCRVPPPPPGHRPGPAAAAQDVILSRGQRRTSRRYRSSAARIWLSHSVPSWRPFGSRSPRSQRHVVIIASTRILHSRSKS
jgi:hypothetical protein